MTTADYQAFHEYIRDMADAMGLRDWTLVTDNSAVSDEGTLAQCTATFGRKRAVLVFAADFRQKPADEQRSTVVHELLHCHFDPMVNLVREMDTILGQPAYQMLWLGFNQAYEFAVDGIAEEWASKLPLIDWPKPAKAAAKSKAKA